MDHDVVVQQARDLFWARGRQGRPTRPWQIDARPEGRGA